MSAGSHPGLMGAAVALIQTVRLGELILGKAISRASKNIFRAGLNWDVCRPRKDEIVDVRAPASAAMAFSRKTAFSVPSTHT
mmetsp:Transcript_89476/g.248505  ORF Transcript_89476/g.248505 Transcript_89476/m.248505 type:complete len:82 (-) Transcript_89476:325-570(-)